MLIMLEAPGSRMIIFVFLKTQDGKDPGRTQVLTQCNFRPVRNFISALHLLYDHYEGINQRQLLNKISPLTILSLILSCVQYNGPSVSIVIPDKIYLDYFRLTHYIEHHRFYLQTLFKKNL